VVASALMIVPPMINVRIGSSVVAGRRDRQS